MSIYEETLGVTEVEAALSRFEPGMAVAEPWRFVLDEIDALERAGLAARISGEEDDGRKFDLVILTPAGMRVMGFVI